MSSLLKKVPDHLKFHLYQTAVQDPDHDVEIYLDLYKTLFPNRLSPYLLREDFCGTFAFSCAWVKKDPKHRALAIDLDQETLNFGKKFNQSQLNLDQKKRLKILRANVITETQPCDLIMAGNFSFMVFLQRKQLLDYFKMAKKSLKRGGVLFLETPGGPEFTDRSLDQRKVKESPFGSFMYYWHHQSYDPIQNRAKFAIHFKLGQDWIKNAFVYDWRLWTVPELRELLAEAGFSKTHVLWEKHSRDGKPTGYYETRQSAKDREFWLCYVVGER